MREDRGKEVFVEGGEKENLFVREGRGKGEEKLFVTRGKKGRLVCEKEN